MRVTDYKALRKLMIDQGIDSISELSRISDVDRRTLGRVLSGKEQPSALVMTKLVDALSIPPANAGTIFFAAKLPIA